MAGLKLRVAPTLTPIAGGEMRDRVQAFDWSSTPLGAMDFWSPSLSLAVDMILATNFPMALRWGPELCLIYNDAFAPTLQEMHPVSLGIAFRDNPEAQRASVGALHEAIMSGASGGYTLDGLALTIAGDKAEPRNAHFTVTYSPIPDRSAASGVGGVLITAVEITQVVETEKTLRDTETRYRLAIEAAGGVGTWDWDIQADKVYADPFYATLHALSPDYAQLGLPARSYVRAIHPDDLVRVRGVGRAAMKAGGDFTDEYRVIQADGSVRWIHARGSCYLDADGLPARNTGVVVDITDRKTVEAALVAARSDHDIAAEAARMGRWDHNPQAGRRFWDARAKAIFGIGDGGDSSDARFERLIVPEDLAAVRAAVQAAQDPSGDGKINLEYRIRRAHDGEVRWIETFGRAYFEAGACTRFVGVISDVSERKLAEAQVLQQQEALCLAVEAADVGIWELDVGTDVLTWSDGNYAMFGVRAGDPLTRETYFDLVHPDDRKRLTADIDRALAPLIRDDLTIEFRAIGRDDGAERWLSAKGKAFFSPEGKALRLLGATVNITDRKRAELHLRLLVNELNHRVKNTLATIQAIASQSFQGARSLPEAKDAFTARIIALAQAHDLLTEENWEGAALFDVLDRLRAVHGDHDGFELDGPGVRLSPRSALSLSMALHELATNAAKYGALSSPSGRVRIAWRVQDRPGAPRLELIWSESGGPTVTPPTRRGFGSRLIERGLAAELSGEAKILFEPTGVICRIVALIEG